MRPSFPTCHCHPQSLDSGSTPEAFVKREIELGTGAICVTDHGSLNACRKVYDLAKANSLIPILGVEAYFRDDNCPILKAKGVDPATHLKYYHLTLHARDQAAYYMLVKKISLARTEQHGSEIKPLLNWADLEEIAQMNVTCGSGCLVGMVQRHLLAHGDMASAEAYYLRLLGMFGDRFLVEVFPHNCSHDWVEGVYVTTDDGEVHKFKKEKKMVLEKGGSMSAADLAKRYSAAGWTGDTLVAYLHYRKPVEIGKKIKEVRLVEEFVENECLPWTDNPDVQAACNEILIGFAKKHGQKVLISDDSHFAYPEDKIVQDIKLQQFGPWRFFGNYARKTTQDAWDYFKANGVQESVFESWVENNYEWADSFKDFTLVEPVSLPVSFYPENTLAHTFTLIKKQGRMPWGAPEYMARLKEEINLLHYNKTIDLLPYFFVGADVCEAYSERGLLTGPGRGSAAGLLLTYLLGITHVDPLRYGLSLDRFLTVDRIRSGKMPDIDFDFPSRDVLCEIHEEERLRVTLEDGSILLISPWEEVTTPVGKMRVDAALTQGLEFSRKEQA